MAQSAAYAVATAMAGISFFGRERVLRWKEMKFGFQIKSEHVHKRYKSKQADSLSSACRYQTEHTTVFFVNLHISCSLKTPVVGFQGFKSVKCSVGHSKEVRS